MAVLNTRPEDRALARAELRAIAIRGTPDPFRWCAARDRWARSIARSACDQGWVPSRPVRYAFLVADRLAALEAQVVTTGDGDGRSRSGPDPTEVSTLACS